MKQAAVQQDTADRSGIVSTAHSADKRQMARDLRKRETVQEKLLWSRLRANKLNGVQFRRQQVIDGFIVDFYCHSAALVVELDGGIHDNTAEYDRDRDAILSARGLRIVRFPNHRIETDLDAVLTEIARLVTPLPQPLSPPGKGE